MPEENLDTSKDGDATASESAVLAQVVEASPALGKAWSQRWQIPLFAAALVAWAWFLVDTHRQIKADQEDPAIVGARIEAMYRGGLHERVVRDATIFQTVHPGSDERAVVEYYGGMSAFVLAQTLPEKKEEYYKRACELLERARHRGLDEERNIEALRTLGRAALDTREWRQAIGHFHEVRIHYPTETNDVLVLKAEAEFGLGQSELAMRTIEDYLVLDEVGDLERVAALLVAAEGFRRDGQSAKALETCQRILDGYPKTPKVNEVYFVKGLALMSEKGRTSERLREAQETFRKVLGMRVRHEELDRKSRFYIGECDYLAGDYESAYTQFRMVAEVDGGTAEGTAASLRVAAIMVHQKEYVGAREAMNEVLVQVPQDGRLSNAFISEREVNEIWSSILRQYLDKKEYAEVKHMIGDGRRLVARGVYFFGQATAYKTHAAGLAVRAEGLRMRGLTDQAEAQSGEARVYYATAADFYARIVNASNDEGTSDLYGAALYNTGLCFFEGGDYARSMVYSRMFIDTSTRNVNKEQTEIRYALALQAMGRHREAIRYLERIQPDLGKLNNTPEAYEAMLAIPRSYLALEEWERAEEGLTKIVEVDKRFSPRKSPVWQKALGELAYVLYRQGKYAQAVPKWDELLRRPRALGRSRFSRLAITYSLGDSYRGIQSYDPKKRRVELTQAADCFDKVRQLAAEQPPEGKLELQMLRMSYLGEADCLYQLEHFERALDAYRVTAGKYPERVEGLSALFGMAACYRRMGPASGTAATLAVKRALWTLEKVKREHPTRVTPFHETCWTGLETGSLR